MFNVQPLIPPSLAQNISSLNLTNSFQVFSSQLPSPTYCPISISSVSSACAFLAALSRPFTGVSDLEALAAAAEPLTPRVAALRGRGGGAPTLPTAAGDAVREGTTGGVDGLDSGRGILEGVSGRSMGCEVCLDGRSGEAGTSEEEVLTWTGASKVATEEEGTVVVEEVVVEEVVVEEVVVEGTIVEEEGTAVEAGVTCVFVRFSTLA